MDSSNPDTNDTAGSTAGVGRRFERWRWSRWSGPILVVAVVVVLMLVATRDPDGALRLAGLSSVLVVAVMYASLVGGAVLGILGAAIAVLFVALSTSPSGSPFHYSRPNLERLVGLIVLLPVVALILGYLRTLLDRYVLRERALRATADAERERVGRILESITDGFFALDREWRYTYVNREAEHLVGRTRAELLGAVVWTAFPALVGSVWDREYHRAVEQGTAVHFESYYPPLDTWFETHAYPSADGLAIYLRSIDARKRAERAILESEERFRQLAENIREVFYVIEWQPFRVVYASPAYEELWGYPRQSLYEHPMAWLDAIHPEDRQRVEAALSANESGELDTEYRIVRAGGEVRWIHDRAFPVNDHGPARRIVGIAEDITVRKAAEQSARQLAAAEARISARDEVLAMVSHDLRSPLGSISMSATLLGVPQPDERRQKYVAVIQRSVERMTRLVQDLLDVARIEAGRLAIAPSRVECARVVAEAREAFHIQAEQKSIQLVTEVADDLTTVWADRERLLQILANLVGNALKFTPEGGRVVVRADPVVGGLVRFSVSDTGSGIPREQAAHLFERFWQASIADRRGVGLGLAIVKGLVEAHRGTVSVISEPGAGSTFSFTIPTTPAAIVPHQEAAASA